MFSSVRQLEKWNMCWRIYAVSLVSFIKSPKNNRCVLYAWCAEQGVLARPDRRLVYVHVIHWGKRNILRTVAFLKVIFTPRLHAREAVVWKHGMVSIHLSLSPNEIVQVIPPQSREFNMHFIQAVRIPAKEKTLLCALHLLKTMGYLISLWYNSHVNTLLCLCSMENSTNATFLVGSMFSGFWSIGCFQAELVTSIDGVECADIVHGLEMPQWFSPTCSARITVLHSPILVASVLCYLYPHWEDTSHGTMDYRKFW